LKDPAQTIGLMEWLKVKALNSSSRTAKKEKSDCENNLLSSIFLKKIRGSL
jgi:hypothetical protein